MKVRLLTFAAIVGLLLLPASRPSAQARSDAYISPEEGPSSAVDAKGVKHHGSDYPKKLSPWMVDRVRSVAPSYPYGDRLRHHQGKGLFRLTLDLKTGAVTGVFAVHSTGFATLDNSAIASLRQWRWKPGKWREIEVPVKFTLSPAPAPPGSAYLPGS